MIDSVFVAVTFLCASDPPYCNAMLSPISTYMSIRTRTMFEDGSSFAFDRIPITASCCPMASTPALNCATFVRSKQLETSKVSASPESNHQSRRTTYSIQFVRRIPLCSIGKTGTPKCSESLAALSPSFSVNGSRIPPSTIFHFGEEQKKPVWLTAHVETSFNEALTSRFLCLLM